MPGLKTVGCRGVNRVFQGVRVQGLGYRVLRFRVSGLGFRVSGFGFWGFGFRVLGLGFGAEALAL